MDLRPLVFTLLCLYVNAQWDCVTHLGKGNCVVLNKCDALMGLKRDKSFFDLLRKSNCGFEQTDPKVCCPAVNPNVFMYIPNDEDCITPDGEGGTCTKLEDCGYMLDQMRSKEFVFDDNSDVTKRSKCNPPGSSKSFYVCCKSKADDRAPLDGHDKCVLSAYPPALGSNCCGIESTSDPRIIGGKETAIDQFPWLAVIEYTRIGYSCGGSLISGKYVLTAAHCLVGSKGKDRKAVSVRLGEYNTTNPGMDCVDVAGGGEDCTDGDIAVPIESYIVHEGYDADQVLQYHDIALIRLKETVNYSDFIRPICLPTTDFSKSAPNGLELYISGWGIFDERQQQTSEIKLFAKIPYVKKEQCNDRYKILGRQALADTQLCVGGEANRDSCKGDSGGPLMLLNSLTYEAAGVISFGPKSCGLQNWPSIYTKVYDYLDWIKANIKP